MSITKQIETISNQAPPEGQQERFKKYAEMVKYLDKIVGKDFKPGPKIPLFPHLTEKAKSNF